MCWTRPMRRGAKDTKDGNCGKRQLRQGGKQERQRNGADAARPVLCVSLEGGIARRVGERLTALQEGLRSCQGSRSLRIETRPSFLFLSLISRLGRLTRCPHRPSVAPRGVQRRLHLARDRRGRGGGRPARRGAA